MGDVIKWNIPIDANMNIHRIQKSIRHANWRNVLAVGYDKDGELTIRSSKMSRKDALFLLEEAKLHVMGLI